jgi:hypothetical protein
MCPEIPTAYIVSSSDPTLWDKVTTQADIWNSGMVLWELFSENGVTSHPALEKVQNPYKVMLKLGALATDPTKAYEKRFPEPTDKNSLLHIIWSCTRVEPTERPNADQLVAKYKQWAMNMQQKLKNGEVSSLFKTCAQELQAYDQLNDIS